MTDKFLILALDRPTKQLLRVFLRPRFSETEANCTRTELRIHFDWKYPSHWWMFNGPKQVQKYCINSLWEPS